jgi:hypothetical protein
MRKTGRDYIRNKEERSAKPPCYAFVLPEVKPCKQAAIPVILETQDPDFYLSGKAAVTSKMARRFDREFYAMFREERKKARAAFYFFKTRPDLPETERVKMQERSRELFVLMQNLNEEIALAEDEEKEILIKERANLDDEFHRLVERNRYFDEAITIENPWMRTLLQYNDYDRFSPITHQMVMDICNCIHAKAEITDEAWLAHPIYPDEPGFKIPKMEFTEFTFDVNNRIYRDVLPDMFRSKFTMQNFPGKGKELYREWIGAQK